MFIESKQASASAQMAAVRESIRVDYVEKARVRWRTTTGYAARVDSLSHGKAGL